MEEDKGIFIDLYYALHLGLAKNRLYFISILTKNSKILISPFFICLKSMFSSIIYGLMLASAGVAILKYRKIVHDWTGGWGWAEHYLGRGGTYTAICLMACGMIILGVATFFGKIDWSQRAIAGQ
jgi:hypothetical protein